MHSYMSPPPKTQVEFVIGQLVTIILQYWIIAYYLLFVFLLHLSFYLQIMVRK